MAGCAVRFALAPRVHSSTGVNRKLALIVAAIVLPGGFLALLGALVVRALSQTERGKKVVEIAERRMRSIGFGAPLFTEREAA